MENQGQISQTKQQSGPWPVQTTEDCRRLIASLVRQSYDIFNTFGKDAKAIENIQLGFFLVLENKPMDCIRFAFNHWIKTQSVMPTPAEIFTIVERENKAGWASFERANQPVVTNLPAPKPKTVVRVPWFGLTPEQFEAQRTHLLPQLKQHLAELKSEKKDAQGYLKYLQQTCGYQIGDLA